MEYIIEKGKHFANFTWHRLLFLSKRKIKKQVIFDESCLVQVKPSGLNKLDGITSILIHKNSGRLTWISNGNTLDIYGYVYLDGVRSQKLICNLNVEEIHSYSVEYVKGSWKFTVDNKEIYMDGKLGWLRFKCFPYFGGRALAPCRIKIYIKKLL